jgi:hypothetical protein
LKKATSSLTKARRISTHAGNHEEEGYKVLRGAIDAMMAQVQHK